MTHLQTPKSVRALFKDPCIRLAGEVSKALKELASSIDKRRHCSPSILSDHLHQALQDLDTALKSQPRLFLNPTPDNSNHHRRPPSTTNLLALAAAAAAGQGGSKPPNTTNNPTKKVSIPTVKTDTCALMEWKSKKETIPSSNESGERKMLRPTLSKIAITSLEFAEALPFAAFASLLVETVARLDHVIEEVEELGRIAHFKEFKSGDVAVNLNDRPIGNRLHNHLPSHGFD